MKSPTEDFPIAHKYKILLTWSCKTRNFEIRDASHWFINHIIEQLSDKSVACNTLPNAACCDIYPEEVQYARSCEKETFHPRSQAWCYKWEYCTHMKVHRHICLFPHKRMVLINLFGQMLIPIEVYAVSCFIQHGCGKRSSERSSHYNVRCGKQFEMKCGGKSVHLIFIWIYDWLHVHNCIHSQWCVNAFNYGTYVFYYFLDHPIPYGKKQHKSLLDTIIQHKLSHITIIIADTLPLQ